MSSPLQEHTLAVRENARWWLTLSRISGVFIQPLVDYNRAVDSLCTPAAFDDYFSDLRARLTQLEYQISFTPADSPDLGALQVRQQALQRAITAWEAVRPHQREALRDLGHDAAGILSSLRVRDLAKYHAFRTATSRLQVASMNAKIEYRVESVRTKRGQVAGKNPERQLVRLTKDPVNSKVVHETVARILLEDDTEELRTEILDFGDLTAHRAINDIEAAYRREYEGGSAHRYRDALDRFTSKLHRIPASGGYCVPAQYGSVLAVAQFFTDFVGAMFGHGDGKPTFNMVPLVDSSWSQNLVIPAVQSEIPKKIAQAVSKMQEINDRIKAGEKVPAGEINEINREALRVRDQALEFRAELGTRVSQVQEGVMSVIAWFTKLNPED